jgi:hypothetical protein
MLTMSSHPDFPAPGKVDAEQHVSSAEQFELLVALHAESRNDEQSRQSEA